MNPRRISLLLAVPVAVALTACSSSSTSGNGEHGGSSGNTTGSGAAPAGGSATPTDAAGLGTLMQSGVASVTSAHITLDIGLSGQSLTGSGDEKLTNGKLDAMDLTETIPGGGDVRIIIIDNKTYAKLPNATSGKPWSLVTPTSTNPVIKQLASSISSAQSSASLGSVSAFVTAADSVKLDGPETVSGTKTTHYSVVVNPAKLPSDFPGKDQLAASGIKTIPVELYIDSTGRPVKVTEKISVQGQDVSTEVTVSKYNAPVTISAPPADQVATS